MKLICPRCFAKTPSVKHHLLMIFTCENCGFRFRGIHADVNFWGSLIRVYGDMGCIHCDVVLGTENADVCANCCKPLPNGPAIQESTSIWDGPELQEYWAKRKDALKFGLITEEEFKWSQKLLDNSKEFRNHQEMKKKEQAKILSTMKLAAKKRQETGVSLSWEEAVAEYDTEKLKELKELKEYGQKIKQEKEEKKQKKQEQIKEKEQAEKQVLSSQLFFWHDYLKLSTNRSLLNVHSEYILKHLKQKLLDNFQLSKQESYKLALRHIENKIKAL